MKWRLVSMITQMIRIINNKIIFQPWHRMIRCETEQIFEFMSSKVGQTLLMTTWRIVWTVHFDHNIKSLRIHMKPDGRIRIGCIPIRSVPNSGIGWERICSDLNDVVGYLTFDFVFYNNIQFISIALTLDCFDVVIGLVTICVLCHVDEFWK